MKKTVIVAVVLGFTINAHAATGGVHVLEQVGATYKAELVVQKALTTSKCTSLDEDEIKQVSTKDCTTYRLTIDDHGGSTIPTEGYGAWEDDQVVFDSNSILNHVQEL